MKKLLKLLPIFFCSTILMAAQIVRFTFEVPTSVAANSTNTTAFTQQIFNNVIQSGPQLARLTAKVTGAAGSTNGNVVIYFAPSFDNTTFETAEYSLIKLTVTPNGTTPVIHGDFFSVSGIYSLRVNRVENNSGGAVALEVTGSATP